MISCGDNDLFTSEFQTTPNNGNVDSTNDDNPGDSNLPDIEVDENNLVLSILESDQTDQSTKPTGEGCDYTGNIVKNGSFEDLDERMGSLRNSSLDSLSERRNWNVFQGLPDVNNPAQDSWRVTSGAGVEVQSNGVVKQSPFGNIVVELDSHGENSNSSISQSVSLCKGDYEFSFIYYARSLRTDDNIIEAVIDGLTLARVDLKKSEDWTLVTQLIKVNKSGDYALEFKADGESNSVGGLIDNIIIKKK